MSKPEQDTFSVASGNKTVNVALDLEELHNREDDILNEDNCQTFWPSRDSVDSAHAMALEPIVSKSNLGQVSKTADGLLKVLTSFNNLSIPKSEINMNAEDIPLVGQYTQAHLNLINDYNEGMWYDETFVENKSYHFDRNPALGNDILPQDQQKLLYLLACKRADNANKWIEDRYQFMGIMSTEMMYNKDRTRASQKGAGWMGGVTDVYHNNPNLKKMIEVGESVYFRPPRIIPNKDKNGSYDGSVTGEVVYKEGVRFKGKPIEKATLMIETFDDSADLYKRKFFCKFVCDLINFGRGEGGEKFTMADYYDELENFEFRKKYLIPFQDNWIRLLELHAGKAYGNAMYGEHFTINLTSKILF